MFGKNQVVNPHFFDDAPTGKLKVTSIFPTIQGEGPYTGCAATFVRLSHCSLACSFCDTHFETGEFLSHIEILSKVRNVWTDFRKQYGPPLFYGQRPFIVITGGEPLLQPAIAGFILTALRSGFQVQIESNGMFYRELPPETILVISPKCNEKTRNYIQPSEKTLARADYLKFIISATEPGYTDIPEFAYRWLIKKAATGGEVFLSPMNCYKEEAILSMGMLPLEQRKEKEADVSFWSSDVLDMEKNKENHRYTSLLAMRLGLRVSLQTHLLMELP